MGLYHYTTETRHDSIIDDSAFLPSTDTVHDAISGKGWYLTDLPPATCEKLLMLACWGKTSLFQRIKYYLELNVTAGQATYSKAHVWFVPYSTYASFTVVSHGETPDCPLKPCSSCSVNPEKSAS